VRQGRFPVDLPASSRRVVAFLALHDRPLLRVFVAGALWPDSPGERAAASLRSALWRLHRIGLALVCVERDRVWLDARVGVDLRDRIAVARTVMDPSEPLRGGELELLVRSGELLPDWYDEWLDIERDRFQQVRLHALESLSGRLVATGRFSQAVEAALAAVASEPLRESAHRALITAHLAEGNRADAIRQYEAYRRLMRDELGLVPSDLIDALMNSFRDHAQR
jgi:DNA-binding SARP family transcriptional activator